MKLEKKSGNEGYGNKLCQFDIIVSVKRKQETSVHRLHSANLKTIWNVF